MRVRVPPGSSGRSPQAPPTPSGLCPAASGCAGGGGGRVTGLEVPRHRDGAVTGGRGHRGPRAPSAHAPGCSSARDSASSPQSGLRAKLRPLSPVGRR